MSNMSEKSGVDLVEEWQTGAIFVVGSVVMGGVVGAAGASIGGSLVGIGGFVVGAAVGFLVLSYLFYGR